MALRIPMADNMHHAAGMPRLDLAFPVGLAVSGAAVLIYHFDAGLVAKNPSGSRSLSPKASANEMGI